jgi:hypothetical protein
VIATVPTRIPGVSILSRQKKRGNDVFELVLTREGIEVHRPERPAQLMSWDRVSEWEIEERKGYVLLTLRGQGAATPLVVPGWTLDDLEVLMREVTSNGAPHQTDAPGPVTNDGNDGVASAAVAVVATPAPPTPAPPTPAPVQSPVPAPAAATAKEAPAPAAPTRAERRRRVAREARRRRLTWRAVVAVVLLGLLASAVILVLLQSAGIIDWSFLGPVA